MKNFLLSLLSTLALFVSPAFAGVGSVGNSIIWWNAPTTAATVLSGYCTDGNLAINLDTNVFTKFNDCNGTSYFTQVWPVQQADVVGLTSSLTGKFDVPVGSTAQYVRGDGSLATSLSNLSSFTNGPGFITSSSLSPYLTSSSAASTYFPLPAGSTSQYLRGDGSIASFPSIPTQTSQLTNNSGFITSSALSAYLTTSTAASTYFPIPAGTGTQYLDGTGTPKNFSAGSRTFNYPARTLASCFQVSASQDSDVNYSVDISATLTLGGGTAALTSYTNSGCTTGAQTLANGAVSSVALLGTSSMPLHAVAKAGTWLKVTGTATGGGTAAIDAVQAETILP